MRRVQTLELGLELIREWQPRKRPAQSLDRAPIVAKLSRGGKLPGGGVGANLGELVGRVDRADHAVLVRDPLPVLAATTSSS
jgi:hypothetical protein